MGLLIQNILQPPILFFMLGIAAVLLKSDLELPPPLPKVLSLYLLFSIGLHGGAELSHSGFGLDVVVPLGLAFVLACVIPVLTFGILTWKMKVPDAAAVAAAYGSVSAVTFLTACSFLDQVEVPYGGHMVGALALMEFPAIVVGLLLFKSKRPEAREVTGDSLTPLHLLRESVLNGSVFLLLGSLVIGYLGGEKNWVKLAPFAHEMFAGALCLFLLDMGMAVARRLGSLREAGLFPIGFALAYPLCAGLLTLLIARVCGLAMGDAFLLVILAASASYIAVPAVMRVSVPEANPGLYIPMALSVTFPLNVLITIPVAYELISRIW